MKLKLIFNSLDKGKIMGGGRSQTIYTLTVVNGAILITSQYLLLESRETKKRRKAAKTIKYHLSQKNPRSGSLENGQDILSLVRWVIKIHSATTTAVQPLLNQMGPKASSAQIPPVAVNFMVLFWWEPVVFASFSLCVRASQLFFFFTFAGSTGLREMSQYIENGSHKMRSSSTYTCRLLEPHFCVHCTLFLSVH